MPASSDTSLSGCPSSLDAPSLDASPLDAPSLDASSLEALDPDASAWGYRMAQGLADVVNPLILPPMLLALVAYHVGGTLGQVVSAAALGLVFLAVIPLGYVVWLLRAGRVATLELRNRANRIRPMLVSLASAGTGLASAWLLGAPATPWVAAFLGAHLVGMVLLLAVTTRWKISIHCAALAGFVSMVAFLSVQAPAATATPDAAWVTLAASLALVPCLMWARVRTRAHTPAQVVGGTGFGLVFPFGALHLLDGLHVLPV